MVEVARRSSDIWNLCDHAGQSVGVFFWQSSSSRRKSFRDNINQARMRSEARAQFVGVEKERERRAARAVQRVEEIRREEKLLSADNDDGEVHGRPS